MIWAVIIFFISLTLGQLGAWTLIPGVTVYLHDILALVLVITTLLSTKPRLHNSTLLKPIVFFVGAALLSLVVNTQRFSPEELLTGSMYLVRWVLYAGLYIVVLSKSLPTRIWVFGQYAVGVGLAAIGLVQYLWYPYLRNLYYLGWDPHKYRVFTTLLDPNFAGILFVFTLFLGIYLLQEKKLKRIIMVSQCVTLVAFFLTYSRSSYLAFLVGVGIVLAYTRRTKLLVGVLAGFLLILFLLPKPGGEGVNLFRTVSTFARIGNWQRGMELIREEPVFGYGFNTLRYVQQEKGWVDDPGVTPGGFPSHAGAGLDNSFQFVWATTGVFGLAMYVLLLWRMKKMSRELMGKKSQRLLGIVYLATLTSILVHSQFSNSLFYPWVMIWMWILAGTIERFMDGTSL